MSKAETEPVHTQLSRRERQIMDIIYARGEASAAEVQKNLPDPPSNTAVRTLLKILEEKGHLTHTQQGRAYIYQPTRPRKQVGRNIFRRVVDTFFEGSLENAMAAHLTDPATEFDQEQLDRLKKLIEDAQKKGH
ncbi:MAG: BlaI/MecI/CopY family transcriptional regulator [Phycisphaeraceae bacterium]